MLWSLKQVFQKYDVNSKVQTTIRNVFYHRVREIDRGTERHPHPPTSSEASAGNDVVLDNVEKGNRESQCTRVPWPSPPKSNLNTPSARSISNSSNTAANSVRHSMKYSTLHRRRTEKAGVDKVVSRSSLSPSPLPLLEKVLHAQGPLTIIVLSAAAFDAGRNKRP